MTTGIILDLINHGILIGKSSPNKLLKGFKYLSSKGFNIVIVGDHNNNFYKQFFNFDSLNKSDREFIDIFIFKIAKFSIIGQMGLKFLPELFGKKVLHHNAMLPQFQSRGIFLPKKYIYLKSKNIISLPNLLKLTLHISLMTKAILSSVKLNLYYLEILSISI